MSGTGGSSTSGETRIGDRNSSDFDTQDETQEFHETYSGHVLDRDVNRIACESLP